MAPLVEGPEILFYDGYCGLCHRAVKFVLRFDQDGTAFRCAPLLGETFEKMVPPERRAGLPDRIVVLTHAGAPQPKSDAFIHILRRHGGRWVKLASILEAIPRRHRDAVYDFVARVRYFVFGQRDYVCPRVSVEWRKRFDP
jgi:predicted DCC family thiol-disulfide oxidoreductase YuxK